MLVSMTIYVWEGGGFEFCCRTDGMLRIKCASTEHDVFDLIDKTFRVRIVLGLFRVSRFKDLRKVLRLSLARPFPPVVCSVFV